MGIDSENHLFRHIPETIRQKIDRSVYNRCKHRLANKINKIRMKLARSFSEFEKLFIVDSMPIEKCKLTCSVTHTLNWER